MLGAKSNSLHQVPSWGLSNRESAAKRQVSYFNPLCSCHRDYKEQLVIKLFQHMTTSLTRRWPLAWRLLKSIEVNSEHPKFL